MNDLSVKDFDIFHGDIKMKREVPFRVELLLIHCLNIVKYRNRELQGDERREMILKEFNEKWKEFAKV